MKQKFLKCKHCGNIIAMVYESGVAPVCCGEKMQEMIPGSTDASVEKHVPVWTVEGNKVTVTVGSVEHPMLPEHFIGWVAIETKEGCQRKPLVGEPKVSFSLTETDSLVAAYAYCNLHGLWKTEA